ncbi:MAG: hypothetical protein ABIP51_20870 [Bacteroidia bacterium]
MKDEEVLDNLIEVVELILDLTTTSVSVVPLNTVIKTAGENITSYTPIAIIGDLAYKFDILNPAHQFAFLGFSLTGVSVGADCLIQLDGEITLTGWGLTPNKQYLAGTAGSISLTNATAGFTKVVGFSVNSNTLMIIKGYTSINK